MNTTAIIILNYNNWEDTINCVKSVEKYNSAGIKYIVVDNGSTRKDTVSSLDKNLKKMFGEEYRLVNEEEETSALTRMTFLVSPTNDGYARGNNKGLKLVWRDSDVSHVLILNNDVLFVQDIIPGLIDKMRELPNCGIVSPLLYKKDMEEYDYNCARRSLTSGQIFTQFLFFFLDPLHLTDQILYNQKYINTNPGLLDKDYFEIQLPSGSCMLLTKDTFKAIGGFDEHTFLYYEENILNKKLETRGQKCYLVPGLKCIHLGASSTKSSPGYFIVKCSADSASYFIEKYSGSSWLFSKVFKLYVNFCLLPTLKFIKWIKAHA